MPHDDDQDIPPADDADTPSALPPANDDPDTPPPEESDADQFIADEVRRLREEQGLPPEQPKPAVLATSPTAPAVILLKPPTATSSAESPAPVAEEGWEDAVEPDREPASTTGAGVAGVAAVGAAAAAGASAASSGSGNGSALPPLSPKDWGGEEPRRRRPMSIRSFVPFAIIGLVVVLLLIITRMGGDSGPSGTLQPGVTSPPSPSSAWTTDRRGAADLQTAVSIIDNKMNTIARANDAQDGKLVTISQELGKLRSEQSDLIQRINEAMSRWDSDAVRQAQALSPQLRRLFTDAAKYLDELALKQGSIDWTDVQTAFTAWVQGRMPGVSPTDIEALFGAARVRREPVGDDLLANVPELVRQRDSAGISRDDLRGIYRLVWSNRQSLSAATAGQLLSLAQIVARASTGGDGTIAFGGAGSGSGEGTAAQIGSGTILRRHLTIGYTPTSSELVPAILACAIPFWEGALELDRSSSAYAATYRLMRTPEVVSSLSRTADSVYTAADIQSAMQAILGTAPTTTATVPIDASLGSPTQRAYVASALLGAIAGEQHRLLGSGARGEEAIARSARAVNSAAPPVSPDRLEQEVRLADLLDLVRGTVRGEAFLPRDTTVRVLDDVLKRTWLEASAVLPAEMRALIWPNVALNAAATGVTFPEQGAAAVEQAVWRATIGGLAERRVQAAIEQEFVPRYGALFELGLSSNWATESRQALRAAVQAMASSLISSGAVVNASNAHQTQAAIEQLGIGAAEKSLASAAVLGSVNETINRLAVGRQANLVKLAREHVQARAEALVTPPYSDERLARIADTLIQEANEVISGRRRVQNPGVQGMAATTPAQTAGGAPVANHRVIRVVKVQGSENARRPATRLFTIPAGSFAEGFTINGANHQLSGGESEGILIAVKAKWTSPSNSRAMTVNLHINASATATAGTDRSRVSLKQAIMVLPSKRRVTSDANGYLVAADGINGLPGEFDGHWDKVLPVGAGIGLLDSVVALAKPTSTNVVVNAGTTTATSSTGASTAQRMAAGGAEGARDPIVRYANKIVDANSPSLLVQPGQFVHVVLEKDLVFDVPVDEYDILWRRSESQAVSETSSFAP